MKLSQLYEATNWEPTIRELVDPAHPPGLHLDQLIYSTNQWSKQKNFNRAKARRMVHGFVLRWMRKLLEEFENKEVHPHLAHTLEYLKGWLRKLNLDKAEVDLMTRYIDRLLAYREL